MLRFGRFPSVDNNDTARVSNRSSPRSTASISSLAQAAIMASLLRQMSFLPKSSSRDDRLVLLKCLDHFKDMGYNEGIARGRWLLSAWLAQALQFVQDHVQPQALDILHDVVVQAVLLADAEDRHDVGVVQLRRRA